MTSYTDIRNALQTSPKSQLVKIILSQAHKIEELQQQLQDKEKEYQALKKKYDQVSDRLITVEKEAARQSAPYRRRELKPVETHKTPGQKLGHKGSYRPKPDHVDQYVEAKLSACPNCGGPLERVYPIDQYIEDIQPPRVEVTQIRTYRGECRCCGSVGSYHPLQQNAAMGSAAVTLGPKVTELALKLQYRYGLTRRKCSSLLKDWFGLSIAPSGLIHLNHRISEKVQSEFKALEEQIKDKKVVHVDETSWYVAAPNHWLWVFAGKDFTFYKVSATRSRTVLKQVIGNSFKGVLVSDCLAVYDNAAEKQHKCYAHHLKAIVKAKELHSRKGEGFLVEVEGLLKSAMVIKKAKDEFQIEQYEQYCQKLEQTADELLLPPRADPVEEKIANRLRKQRPFLFTFLYNDQVEATNNLAERQLRPAVISRKVSCGNRSEKGAQTWQTITTLLTTYAQRNINFGEIVEKVLKIYKV